MKDRQINFGFRIPEDQLKKLKYIAKYDCRSTGRLIRMLIYSCVKKFEKEHGEIS